MKKIPLFDHIKFLSMIKINTNGCWIWSGGSTKKGYGRTSFGNSTYYTHRLAYSLFVNEITKNMLIDHTCRNRTCCNPDHLREVSNKQNALENSIGEAYKNSLKTHCARGHEFNSVNSYICKNGRVCRICHRINNKKYREKLNG